MADGRPSVPWTGQQTAGPFPPYPQSPPPMSYHQPPQFQPNPGQVIYPAPMPQPQTHGGPAAPRFKVMKDCIVLVETNQAIYTISRPKGSSLSSNRDIVISHMQGNAVLGSIKIHTMLSNDVDMSVNRRETTIKVTESLSGKEYWSFKCPMAPQGSLWWFVEQKADADGLASVFSALGDGGDDGLDELGDLGGDDGKKGFDGALVLQDAKKDGNTLARMEQDVLTIMQPPLSRALVDEVLVSAVGLAVAAKKKRKNDKQALKVIAHVAGA